MNLDRILATLKKERRGIDKAIDALERLRSARSKRNKQRSAQLKKESSEFLQKFEDRHSKEKTLEHSHGHGSKLIPFLRSAKRIS